MEKNPDGIAICLNCYKVKFTERNTSNPKSIEKIFGKGDFISLINNFVKTIDTNDVFRNKDRNRILYLQKSLNASKTESIYSGVVMKGHNGAQASIDELIKNEIKTVGTVKKDQYSCLPYFFLVSTIPNQPHHLIFIAQSYRQYGFKTIFEEAFNKFARKHSADTTVSFNPLSVGSLFEKYIKDGKINRIRFLKHGLQKGVESIVDGDVAKKDEYEMELSIKAKHGFIGIKKHLKYDDASFIEQLHIDGFEFNETLVDITVAGRSRVMNISKPKSFSASYDITHDVNIDKNTNLPDFNDVMKQAVDILKNDLLPSV